MWIEPVVRACKVDDAIIDDDVDDLQSVTCSGESGSGSGDGHGESNNPNGDEGDKQPGGVGEGTGEGSGGSGSSVAAATTPAVAATTTTGGEEGDACAGEEGKKQQKQQRRSKLWCTVAHNQYFLLQKRRKRKMAPPVPPSSSTNSFSSTFQPVTKSNNNKEQQLQQQHQVAERSRSVPGSAPGSMPTSAKGSPLKLATTPPSSSSSTLASMSMLNRNRAQTERTNNNDFKSKSAAFPIPRGRSDADAYLTARQEEREQALGHKPRELFAHVDPPVDVSLTQSMKPITAIIEADSGFERRRVNSAASATARASRSLKRVPSSPALPTVLIEPSSPSHSASSSAASSPGRPNSGRSVSHESGAPQPPSGFLRSLFPGFLSTSTSTGKSLPTSPRGSRSSESVPPLPMVTNPNSSSRSNTYSPRSNPVEIRQQSAQHRSRTLDESEIAVTRMERAGLDSRRDERGGAHEEGGGGGFLFPDEQEASVEALRREMEEKKKEKERQDSIERERKARMERDAVKEKLAKFDLVELEMPWRVILRTDAFPHLFNRAESRSSPSRALPRRDQQIPGRKRSGGFFKFGLMSEDGRTRKGTGRSSNNNRDRAKRSGSNSDSEREHSSASSSSSSAGSSSMTGQQKGAIPADVEILVIVALGKTKKHIQDHWEWLNHQLIPALDDFDIGIEGHTGLQEETALYQYLLMKISGLATEEDLSGIDRGNKQLEMTKGIILDKMRQVAERKEKLKRKDQEDKDKLLRGASGSGKSKDGKEKDASSLRSSASQRRQKKKAKKTKRVTRSEIFDTRKRSLPGHSRLAATEENKQVLFKSLVESMGMVWANELAALVATDECALVREIKREGILWITANNIYFSCESCKLLLPMREIESMTRSKGISKSGNLDSIQLNTEDGMFTFCNFKSISETEAFHVIKELWEITMNRIMQAVAAVDANCLPSFVCDDEQLHEPPEAVGMATNNEADDEEVDAEEREEAEAEDDEDEDNDEASDAEDEGDNSSKVKIHHYDVVVDGGSKSPSFSRETSAEGGLSSEVGNSAFPKMRLTSSESERDERTLDLDLDGDIDVNSASSTEEAAGSSQEEFVNVTLLPRNRPAALSSASASKNSEANLDADDNEPVEYDEEPLAARQSIEKVRSLDLAKVREERAKLKKRMRKQKKQGKGRKDRKRIMFSNFVATVVGHRRTSLDRGFESSCYFASASVDNVSLPYPLTRSALVERQKVKHFRSLFRLPRCQVPEFDMDCNLQAPGSPDLHGRMYITTNYLCYHSTQQVNEENTTVMLLLGDVVKLKTRSATSVQCTIMKGNVDKEKVATRRKDLDEKTKTVKSSSIILHTQNKKHVILLPGGKHSPEELHELLVHRSEATRKANVLNYIMKKEDTKPTYPGMDPRLFKNPRFFTSDFLLTDIESARGWEAYFSIFGRGRGMIYDRRRITNLVWDGIPEDHRGEILKLLAGTENFAPLAKGEYQAILTAYRNRKNAFMEQIQTDLRRSFPDHQFYQKQQGIDCLRRVLTAYSWRNPNIGYTQGMNMITSVLLCYMGEEDAFWMLSYIVEYLLPDYYTSGLFGLIIDQRVFDEIAREFMPEAHAVLAHRGTPMVLVSSAWFMALFIGFLPLEAVLWVLAVLLWEGPTSTALFRVAMAILKIREPHIMNNLETNPINLASTVTCEQLKQGLAAIDEFLSFEKISQLRQKHRCIFIKEMMNNNAIAPADFESYPSISEIDRSKLAPTISASLPTLPSLEPSSSSCSSSSSSPLSESPARHVWEEPAAAASWTGGHLSSPVTLQKPHASVPNRPESPRLSISVEKLKATRGDSEPEGEPEAQMSLMRRRSSSDCDKLKGYEDLAESSPALLIERPRSSTIDSSETRLVISELTAIPEGLPNSMSEAFGAAAALLGKDEPGGSDAPQPHQTGGAESAHGAPPLLRRSQTEMLVRQGASALALRRSARRSSRLSASMRANRLHSPRGGGAVLDAIYAVMHDTQRKQVEDKLARIGDRLSRSAEDPVLQEESSSSPSPSTTLSTSFTSGAPTVMILSPGGPDSPSSLAPTPTPSPSPLTSSPNLLTSLERVATLASGLLRAEEPQPPPETATSKALLQKYLLKPSLKKTASCVRFSEVAASKKKAAETFSQPSSPQRERLKVEPLLEEDEVPMRRTESLSDMRDWRGEEKKEEVKKRTSWHKGKSWYDMRPALASAGNLDWLRNKGSKEGDKHKTTTTASPSQPTVTAPASTPAPTTTSLLATTTRKGVPLRTSASRLATPSQADKPTGS